MKEGRSVGSSDPKKLKICSAALRAAGRSVGRTESETMAGGDGGSVGRRRKVYFQLRTAIADSRKQITKAPVAEGTAETDAIDFRKPTRRLQRHTDRFLQAVCFLNGHFADFCTCIGDYKACR